MLEELLDFYQSLMHEREDNETTLSLTGSQRLEASESLLTSRTTSFFLIGLISGSFTSLVVVIYMNSGTFENKKSKRKKEKTLLKST